jgi:hypothetical protein
MHLSYPLSTTIQVDSTSRGAHEPLNAHLVVADNLQMSNVANSFALSDTDDILNSILQTGVPSSEGLGAEFTEQPSLEYGIYELGDPFELNGLDWLFPSAAQF